MAAKRCPFCKQKLDPKGLCQNKQCVDYKRTQMIEENTTNENNNSNQSVNK